MKKRRERMARVGLGLIGAVLVLTGLSRIYGVNLNHTSYWGGVVFAPIAVVVGILILIIVIFRWKAIDQMFGGTDSTSRSTDERDNWRKW